ncbi:MAG: carbohydrate ABC transporter permease [Saccharofermentanales bacterium]
MFSNKAKKRIRKTSFQLFVQILLIAIAMMYVVPLLWMLFTSLKSLQEIQMGRSFFPIEYHFENFPVALNTIPFLKYTGNTIFIVVISTIGTVLSASIVAYSFARLRWPGRDVLFVILLSTLMLPSQVLQVQNFILFNRLNWIDTYLPLTVPFFFNAGAFNIFLLRQFYKGVPMELSEAAKIDGCGEFRLWIEIVSPLCKPIIAAIAVFAFMGGWNDFFNPLIYLRSDHLKTLALGLRDFQQQRGTQWNYMMAVSLISMMPTLIMFFSFQKYFVEGLTTGAVKG